MKKKIFALALCAAVSLTAGCAKKDLTGIPDTSGTVSTPSTSSTVSTPDTSSTVSTPDTSSTVSTPETSTTVSIPESSPAESTSDATTSESAPETSNEDSTPDAENNGIARGKWNGDVFTSDFFGFTVTLDQDCEIMTDEDLALMNGFSEMTDENFVNAVKNSNANMAIYDMYATYHDIGNIALACNKYAGMSLDNYVQANVNGLNLVGSFKDTKTDTVSVGGKNHPCVYTTLVSGTAEVKELMIMYNNGDYFAILTFVALSDPELNDMVNTVLG